MRHGVFSFDFPFTFLLMQINLKLILVSSKTAEFLFNETDTVAAITQHVYDNWPSGIFFRDMSVIYRDHCPFWQWYTDYIVCSTNVLIWENTISLAQHLIRAKAGKLFRWLVQYYSYTTAISDALKSLYCAHSSSKLSSYSVLLCISHKALSRSNWTVEGITWSAWSANRSLPSVYLSYQYPNLCNCM